MAEDKEDEEAATLKLLEFLRKREENIADWDYEEKTQDLIDASKHAFNELVDALACPLNLAELADEKVQAAVKAKKLALVDAKDILRIMKELEKMVEDGELDLDEKGAFQGGGPEDRFKKKKKKKA